ncbi:ferritin-like superfamily [Armillaria luteobubalina]|uniref:Ferritin-like superfamily n=1 Tax=Armillaria luteobubalina TaxID=153913 RepID=A0AA39Q7V5_9AGAR|nr:ferritin-like superfamily [Armillaria luteobubalina]
MGTIRSQNETASTSLNSSISWLVHCPIRQNPEVLLDPTDDCLIIFPLKDNNIWNTYKLQESSFWTAEEVDISGDANDWDNKLSESECALFSMILAFFASADSIVCENLLQHFSSEVQLPEARFFYSFQAAMENIHSEVYSSLIQELIRDTVQCDRLLHGIEEFPCVAAKTSWALKWIQSSASFPQHLIAFAAVEGLICRDEGIHTDFACLLYGKLKNRLSITVLTTILTEALKRLSIMPPNLLGLNIESMTEYIEYVTDRLLQSLGAPKAYNVTNPFPFMEMISLWSKTNFFER